MPLITATNLAKSYGQNDVFQGISLSIPHRARIALVGPNGVGKTTLLRILVGEEQPSAGEVHRARGVHIGYLPQETSFTSERSLWEECLLVFAALVHQQETMAHLEKLMADPIQASAALEEYGRLQQAFERAGGYTYETRIRQTLSGMGFEAEDYNRPLSQLSGGQRTRALLARLLLEDPHVLLLDEPTNHLDIDAVEWLETYLRDWQGAVVLVSHDRYFMDQVVDTIWEMTPSLEIYRGNYSAYLAQRSERYQRQLKEYQAQQEFIEKEEDFIRRNIAGQNTRQAQGRLKRLQRLIEEARVTPPREQHPVRLCLESSKRSGDLVLRTLGLKVGYASEGSALFSVPDLTLVRGECAAIIGPNGAGKTTFLKTLLGQVPPLEGKLMLGASLKIGYFAQAHEDLDPELDLMEEIERAAPAMRPAEIRSYLAQYLFTGDDVFKKVKSLSGGERGRLALAKLALAGANLLLLDEPTNHLDLPSQEVLQSVLADYDGTILLVSHDRYLIDALATQIWAVDPRVGVLRVFEGSYSEYHAALADEAASRIAEREARSNMRSSGTARSRAAAGPSGQDRKRRLQIEQLESRIAEMEALLSVLSSQLENPPADPVRVQHLGQEYVRVQSELEGLLGEWERLAG